MASNRIVIGNYELHETIGNGSFGKVKLAVHQYTGHNVALKIINRRKIANMDMVGRIKREILFLRFLRHPHIIKLYEVITTPTDILMVMEFAGGELFKYIVEKGRLSEDESRRFFQQLISAVDYCHRHNIVHRDLKPENLLLDEFHNLKIADFGLSNIMADGEFLKTSCGSPNYAAPEVINGKYYAGPEVDVWSCGVILYVMLCGRLPFDDENIPALFRKISSGVFSLPNSLSNEAKALLLAMLVVEPGKRITIPEIQELAWYKKDLPEYLIPSPENEDDELHNVDEALLKELTKKMGFNRMTIYQALQEVENNQIKVTYQLLADHKRGNLSRAKPSESFFSGISPSWSGNQSTMLDTADPGASLAPSNIKVLSSSLPKRLETPPPMPDPTAAPNTPVGTITVLSAEKKAMVKKKTRSRWHYGLRSKSAPLDIMLEIYRALKSVGMEWKPIDAYHVRARWTYKGQTVKLDIQIYKVDRGSYLVDFKNSTPSVMAPDFSSMGQGTSAHPDRSMSTPSPEAFGFSDMSLELKNGISSPMNIPGKNNTRQQSWETPLATPPRETSSHSMLSGSAQGDSRPMSIHANDLGFGKGMSMAGSASRSSGSPFLTGRQTPSFRPGHAIHHRQASRTHNMDFGGPSSYTTDTSAASQLSDSMAVGNRHANFSFFLFYEACSRLITELTFNG